MDTTTLFLFFVFACLGFAAGAIVAGMRQRTPTPGPGDQPPAPEGTIEVLRVWRAADGRVRLGMDSQQLASTTELQPEQRRRLVKLVIDLRPWLETPPDAATGRPAAEQPVAPPPKAPKKPAEEKPAAPVIKSIIEQIDDVLQAKLAGSPLAGRDIHLAEGPDGAVIVKVGLSKFQGIDAVPEAEVKDLIRQAVTDWEKGTH